MLAGSVSSCEDQLSARPPAPGSISAIIPTIGRAGPLSRLLHSLAAQSLRPDEVVVADASIDAEVTRLIASASLVEHGLSIRHIKVQPPNAVRQRRAAIEAASGETILLLDDDVVLEPACLEALVTALRSDPEVVAVTADLNNQSWPRPTVLWRCYLRWCCGLAEDQWQGRVIGPLLRFGYYPVPTHLAPMQWLGAGNSLLKRSAYDAVGGFSDFFLHRCTMNEDVDLGLKLGRIGRIFLCPAARMAHLHAPGGRVSAPVAAEDDLFNRYMILRRTCGRSIAIASGLVLVYFLTETTSSLVGCLRRIPTNAFGDQLWGRVRALCRILGLVTSHR